MSREYGGVDGEGNFIFPLAGQRLVVAAHDLSGTFTGTIQARVGEQQGMTGVTATLVQKGQNLSGTWTTPVSSGTMTGIVDGLQVRAFKVFQSFPCPMVLHGTATLEATRHALSGSYAGRECDNQPLSAVFRLNRVERDPKFEDSPLDLHDLFNIAVSYYQQGRYEEALDYFQRARRSAEEKRDDVSRAQMLFFIGQTYQRLNLSSDAIDYLEQSQRLAEQVGKWDTQVAAIDSLGLLYSMLGRFDVAQGYF